MDSQDLVLGLSFISMNWWMTDLRRKIDTTIPVPDTNTYRVFARTVSQLAILSKRQINQVKPPAELMSFVRVMLRFILSRKGAVVIFGWKNDAPSQNVPRCTTYVLELVILPARKWKIRLYGFANLVHDDVSIEMTC